MRTLIFSLIFAAAGFGQQTYYKNEDFNFEYTAPDGWEIEDVRIYELTEVVYLDLKSKNIADPGSFSVSARKQDFIETKSSLFSYMNLIWNLKKDAPYIPFMEDTTLSTIDGNIHYASFEIIGKGPIGDALMADVSYRQVFGGVSLEFGYSTGEAYWDMHRDDNYKNFLNLNYLNTTSTVLKKKGGMSQYEGKKLFYDLLGRRATGEKKSKVKLFGVRR